MYESFQTVKGQGGATCTPVTNLPLTGGRQPNEAGIHEAARLLQASRREVQRAGKIAKLYSKAQDEAKRLGCDDHQAALLAAAEETDKDSQIRVLREMANRTPRQTNGLPRSLGAHG